MLYTVHSLMGGTAAGVWKVGGEGDPRGSSTSSEVHMEQVVRLLQTAFQVTQETMDRLRKDAQSRPVSRAGLGAGQGDAEATHWKHLNDGTILQGNAAQGPCLYSDIHSSAVTLLYKIISNHNS